MYAAGTLTGYGGLRDLQLGKSIEIKGYVKLNGKVGSFSFFFPLVILAESSELRAAVGLTKYIERGKCGYLLEKIEMI